MSEIRVNTIRQVSSDNLPTNLLPVTASSWVNFNGNGAISIRDSYNISSVTDLGVGQYRVNFTTAMGNSSYGVVVTGDRSASAAGESLSKFYSIATTSVEIATQNATSFEDFGAVCLITVGGQS